MSYKPKPLPALTLKAERQVGDELLMISRELDSLRIGGSAADISYDNSSSGLNADNVQGAIDELADTNGGWGGYTVDESSGVIITLPASGAWLTINPSPKLAMEGSSGLAGGSDGSLWITNLAPIQRVTVHASVYLDSGPATLSEAVKMRIIRLPDGGSEAPAGGVVRTKWTATDAVTGFFCNLDSSLVNGAIDGVFDLRYCKYFVQLSQTGGSSVEVRLRNFEFWCEYL